MRIGFDLSIRLSPFKKIDLFMQYIENAFNVTSYVNLNLTC